MSKATTTDLREEGWRADQFGGGFANGAAFDAYLTTVLGEASRWVEAKLGTATYAAAVSPSYLFDTLKRAELCFAAARLWKRRATFLDSQGNTGLDQSAAAERSAYLRQANAAMECAEAALVEGLRLAGVDPEVLGTVSGFAIGHIETGPFPISSTGALNV